MAHGAYAVAMLGIFCVALIVCVALMSAIDNCDIMFARVLTPAPVVVSCLSLSHRSSSSRQADLMTQRQPDPQQELRQLLDEFADSFDDRSRRRDARNLLQAGYRRSRATADATLPCARPVLCVEVDTTLEQFDGGSDRVRGEEGRWCAHCLQIPMSKLVYCR